MCVAYYPSPAGSVESLLAIDAAISSGPPLRAPEIEALLVDRVRGANDAWIVGIDTCYRLVALDAPSIGKGLPAVTPCKVEIDRILRGVPHLHEH